MIAIQAAALHILDFHSGLTVYSEQEMTLEGSAETFLLKHIEKSFRDPDLKRGVFYEDSVFAQKAQAYLGGALDFIAFSRHVADTLYAAVCQSDKLDSSDVLVLDLTIDDERFLAVFKCNNRPGFIHQVTQTEDGVRNEIINHYAILPGLSQKMDECAFVSATGEIRLAEKKYAVSGEEVRVFSETLLECDAGASPKEAFAVVNTVAKKVAEAYGQSTTEAATKAKAAIVEAVQTAGCIDPTEIGRAVFAEAPGMQAQYREAIQAAGLPETVEIAEEYAQKRAKYHKVKTDTGIELRIPLEYFQNSDYVEFVNNPDGTLSINLKKILKLTDS